MPRIEITGIGIEYELIGEVGAHAVALTPGGRYSKDAKGIRQLGEKLVAGGKRVLLWDRPNAGASDVCFSGDNESALQGRVLTELIRALDLGPAAIGGGSAGSRTTLQAAAHDPEAISHLLQWWISGGVIGLLMLGASYCSEAAIAARAGGMAAVAGLPTWKEQIERNPRNKDAILAQDVDEFIATMERWAMGFVHSETSPIPTMTPDDFARMTMPTLIFRGSPVDIWHSRKVSDQVEKLIPHAEAIDPPWADTAPMARLTEAAMTGGSPFLDWPLLAPAILEFTSR